jgi:hypothetical protein
MPSSGFSTPEPYGAWAPPDNTATAVSTSVVDEVSYRDLAIEMSPGDLAAVSPDAGYLFVLAAQPSGTAISYDLATGATGETVAVRGSGQWVPTALLSLPLSIYGTTATFPAGTDLSDLAEDEAMLIGTEIVRVDAIDNDTKEVTIARGCADTVPQAHAAGTRAWIYEGFAGTDGRDYATAEDVNVRILTITPSERLAVGDVAGTTIEIGGRQGRPYPPGDVQVNGTPFGSLTAAQTGDIVFTWTHRDRVIQDDRLIEHEAASIGPEAGTTYTVRIYDGVTLLRTTSGISGATWTYDGTMITADGEPTEVAWTVEIESVRSSLVSWQKYRFDVPRRQDVIIAGGDASEVIVTGYAGTNTPQSILIAGGDASAVTVTGK